MFKWKIEIEKPQGRYRPSISIYGWIEGQFPDGKYENRNPLNINSCFSLPIFRLPGENHFKEISKKYQRALKLPFTVWSKENPDDKTVPCDKDDYQIIGGHVPDFIMSTPCLLRRYYLDWIPNATPETYENIVQFFIDNWMTPLEKEYNKRLTEAINSQAIKIIKTNDNNNDNNNNNQSKVTRKIET